MATNELTRHDLLGPLTIPLAYRPPIAWQEMLRYFAGRAIPGVEAVADHDGVLSYMRSVRLGDACGWLRITHVPDDTRLTMEAAPTLAPVLTSLLARVRNQFDLDANPAVIEAHLEQDSLLARQICLEPGMRVPGAFDAFELAVRAVLGQQVSVAAATTLSGRLASSFGDFVATPFAKVMLHFPSATRLALVPCETIAQIGLPKTRAQTICNLARFSEGGGLSIAPGASLGATIAHLKTVGGIGEWTAQYIAMRALRFADAFPAGDLGLQKAAAQEPGESGPGARLNEKRLLARAAGWTPWRAYAALMLWHSLVKPN